MSMPSNLDDYPFPVWGTQGGGLVRLIDGKYIFVEAPDCPGLYVGDELPELWSIASANRRAREEREPSISLDSLIEADMRAMSDPAHPHAIDRYLQGEDLD